MDSTPSHPTFDDRPPEERGILLGLDPTGTIVLGTYRLDYDYGGASGQFLPRIRLVAAHASGARCTRLDVFPGRPRIAQPRKAPSGWATTSFFDVKIERLEGTSARPCFVYAFFGAYVSNVVRITPADAELSP